MSTTSFNPKVKVASTSDAPEQRERSDVDKREQRDKSSFSAEKPCTSAWKAMTKNIESPSIIDEMYQAAEDINTEQMSFRDLDTAYYVSLMFGDNGNTVRRLDNKHYMTIEDKPDIVVPTNRETREMFSNSVIQQDPFPVYERFVMLDQMLHELLEINTESLRFMDPTEAEVSIERVEEIKDLIQQNQVNIEIAYCHLLNHRAQQRADLEELENP